MRDLLASAAGSSAATPVPDSAKMRAESAADVGSPAPGSEEGEEMDAENGEDAAMMAMMGMSGFGSTKVGVALGWRWPS